MATIKHIQAIEVLDSRGNPTVCTKITTDDGCVAQATVPSGASTGSKEALEMRDGGKRYLGKGVQKAVDNVNQAIAPLIVGKNPADQRLVDEIMCKADGTDNKSSFGANAILSVSLATARVAALCNRMPLYKWLGKLYGNNDEFVLPTPMMNIINGGQHADNLLDIQEFMIYPHGFNSFHSRLQAGAEIFHQLKSQLLLQKMTTAVGDEGGFAPDLQSTQDSVEIILRAIEKAGYQPGEQVSLTLDMAASEFFQNNKYHLSGENKVLSTGEMVDFTAQLAANYPIVSIEDPMHEEDWQGWKQLTSRLGDKVQLVGDDLFVTNPAIFRRGIDEGVANAILIKVNQIGTLSETLECISMAKQNNYKTIISHRSGESCDTFIADLAVATASGQIKTGSLCRSDRVSKYNRLLWIEQEVDL